MKYEVGRKYDVSKVIAENPQYSQTPNIVECHCTFLEGLFSKEVVLYGETNSSMGFPIGSTIELESGEITLVEEK